MSKAYELLKNYEQVKDYEYKGVMLTNAQQKYIATLLIEQESICDITLKEIKHKRFTLVEFTLVYDNETYLYQYILKHCKQLINDIMAINCVNFYSCGNERGGLVLKIII